MHIYIYIYIYIYIIIISVAIHSSIYTESNVHIIVMTCSLQRFQPSGNKMLICRYHQEPNVRVCEE